MGRPTLIETLDIDAAFAASMVESSKHQNGDGTVVDAGPGTKFWSEDAAYKDAVGTAASNTLRTEMRAQGVDIDGLDDAPAADYGGSHRARCHSASTARVG